MTSVLPELVNHIVTGSPVKVAVAFRRNVSLVAKYKAMGALEVYLSQLSDRPIEVIEKVAGA